MKNEEYEDATSILLLRLGAKEIKPFAVQLNAINRTDAEDAEMGLTWIEENEKEE